MSDRRYIVVLGASLVQFTVIGLLFSYGVFFAEFEAEFGWSRTFLSACSAAATLMMGTLAMVGGRLSDRFGPRLVLGFTGLCYGTGFVLMSQVTQPWQLFVLFAVFGGLGLGTHDVVTLSTIARWFNKRRGIMSGVIKSGTAAGQVAVPPLAAVLIALYGWQSALMILGATAVLVLLLAAAMMQHPPKPAGGHAPQTGLSFAEARSGRVFWTLCAIQFLFFPALMSVPLHLAVHGMDLGMMQGVAAGLLSVIGAASVAGRLTMGAAVDRIGGRNAYALCLSILLASLAGLTLVSGHAALFAVVAVYGFGHGALFVVVSPTVAEHFGMKAHGAIFGTVLFFGTIGGSVGPILAGLAFDRLGSYQPAFITLACGVGLALVLSRTLPRV